MKRRAGIAAVLALLWAGPGAAAEDQGQRAGRLFRQAQSLIAAGDRAGAAKVAAEIKAIALEHPDFHYNLALLYEGLDDFGAAESEYQAAIRLDPKQEDYSLDLGALYLARKRPDRALLVYQAAEPHFPRSAKLQLALATTYAAMERNEEALRAFRKAEELQPGFAGAWRSHGAFALFIDRTDEARQALERAVRLDPRDALAHYYLGTLMRKDPAFSRQQSLEQFDKAVSLAPGLVKAWVEKGMVLREMSRFEEAVAAFESAVKLDPGFSRAWYQLGMLYRRLGRMPQSAEAMARFRETKAAEEQP